MLQQSLFPRHSPQNVGGKGVTGDFGVLCVPKFGVEVMLMDRSNSWERPELSSFSAASSRSGRGWKFLLGAKSWFVEPSLTRRAGASGDCPDVLIPGGTALLPVPAVPKACPLSPKPVPCPCPLSPVHCPLSPVLLQRKSRLGGTELMGVL